MKSSRRARILVQVNSLELGGTQINAVDLATAMQNLGFDSFLIGPRDSLPRGPSLFDVARDRGVPLEAYERPKTTLGGARDLNRIAHRHKVDLVHTYGTWGCRPAYWGPCLLARRGLVMTVYEMEVDPIVYRAPTLIVGTGYLLDDLRERHGPVQLISPPVDLVRDDTAMVPTAEFLTEHDLNPAHRRIVVVSRLDNITLRPVKCNGIETAIRSITQIGSDDVDLVIVGTGNDEKRLRGIGAEVNSQMGRRACVFVGPLSDPRPAYAAADIVIGMGGSAARGLSFGKPLVVAGEYGWFMTFRPETAQAIFRTSFWSEEHVPDPVAVLLAQLKPLLLSAEERERLGLFGRAFAVRNFGLANMAERLAGIYDEVLVGYRVQDWLYDLRLEAGWAARRVNRCWKSIRGRTMGPFTIPENIEGSAALTRYTDAS